MTYDDILNNMDDDEILELNEYINTIEESKNNSVHTKNFYDNSEEDELNALQHFGIKGMKWGIRRTPAQLGHRRDKLVKKRSKFERKALKARRKGEKITYKVDKQNAKRFFRNDKKVIKYSRKASKQHAKELKYKNKYRKTNEKIKKLNKKLEEAGITNLADISNESVLNGFTIVQQMSNRAL